MSADDLDEFMRGLRSSDGVSEDRVARVMDGVMAGLEARRAPANRFFFLADWLERLSLPARFAVPMAAAVLLGIVVGQGLRPSDEMVALTRVFDAAYGSTYGGLGY